MPSLRTLTRLCEVLAKDKSYRVRAVVAENRSTALGVLEALAKDHSYRAPVLLRTPRRRRAHLRRQQRTRETPASLLEALAKDENEWIRQKVAASTLG